VGAPGLDGVDGVDGAGGAFGAVVDDVVLECALQPATTSMKATNNPAHPFHLGHRARTSVTSTFDCLPLS